MGLFRNERKFNNLNPGQLKKLPPGRHSDGLGVYLDVQSSGSRSWILRTAVKGKRTEIGLGRLSTTTLAAARQEAAELRSRARKGEDILESRRIAKRQAPTFKEVTLKVHANLSATFRSDQHSKKWIRSMEQYVFPVFGGKPVDSIETPDVLAAVGPIWTRILDTARRVLRRIKTVMDYCQSAGYRNVIVAEGFALPLPNPCEGIKATLPKNRTREHHRAALPYRDLPAFIEKLRTCRDSLTVKLALEMTILTAARTVELINARWEEFDTERATWGHTGLANEDGCQTRGPAV